MKIDRLIVSPLLALLLGTGCVSKKDHEALQRQLDATRAELEGTIAERDSEIVEISEALEAEKAALADANTRIGELEAHVSRLEGELATMEGLKADSDAELAKALASRKALKASIEEMREALRELGKRKAAAERRIAAYKKLLERFKPLIDAGKLKVKIADGRMVLVLPMDILFASGKAELSAEGRSALMAVGQALAGIPDRRFQVEGHTDTVPISTKKYPSNWELASARALVVVKAMLDAGVKPTQLSAASYGEHKPVGSDKAKNRRIEIVVVPDLSDLPGFEELNKLGGSDSLPAVK